VRNKGGTSECPRLAGPKEGFPLRRRRRAAHVGLPPGALVHVGEARAEPVRITVMDYDPEHVVEQEVKSVEECAPFKESPAATWINIDGIHQVEVIEQVGKYFNIHPLVLEDILDTAQRPKVEDYGDYCFVVLKMLSYDETKGEISAQQVSLIFGPAFVMSFEEAENGFFAPVRERIRSGKGQARTSGPDYLAYALIDAIVDHYFAILERLGDRVEYLEEDLVADPSPETLREIQHLKRSLIALRRSIWPVREVVAGLQRGETRLIQPATLVYLRDVYDHTIQIIETIETTRDVVSGMLDIYLSSVSNKLNAIMKVLTMIATIFIPLTFIVGLYGMNFHYMPELSWRWGYATVWTVMIVISVLMLWYFRRKRWL
jgi:magnesium transporter